MPASSASFLLSAWTFQVNSYIELAAFVSTACSMSALAPAFFRWRSTIARTTEPSALKSVTSEWSSCPSSERERSLTWHQSRSPGTGLR